MKHADLLHSSFRESRSLQSAQEVCPLRPTLHQESGRSVRASPLTRGVPGAGIGVTQELGGQQNLGHTPDLPTQNLLFGKISLLGTLTLRSTAVGEKCPGHDRIVALFSIVGTEVFIRSI